MSEFLVTYLEPIIAFVTGGGLVSIFTLKYTKKQAEANAMKAVQEVYQATIKDMQEDKSAMKEDIKEMRVQISELKLKVDELENYKCIIPNCNRRKRDYEKDK